MSIIIHYLMFIIILFPNHNYTNTKDIISDSAGVPQDFLPYSQPMPGSEQSIEMTAILCGEFEKESFKNYKTGKVRLYPYRIGKLVITRNQYDLLVKESIATLDLSNSILTTQSAVKVDVLYTPFPQPSVEMSFIKGIDYRIENESEIVINSHSYKQTIKKRQSL